MSDVDEALRQVLIEIVSSAGSLPVEQRKQIVTELQKLDIRQPEVKEQLKSSFGTDTFEAAMRSAASRVSAEEPSVSRERLMPKALCTGGDVGILCGVDLDKERRLLRSIILAKRTEVFPLITAEYVAERYCVTSDELAAFLSASGNRVLQRLVQMSARIKRDIQRAEAASLKTGTTTTTNLKTLTLLHVLKALEIIDLPAIIRDRWEARTLALLQSRVLAPPYRC